ncbi:MAG TPA: SDR family oxidoreductase [Mycobacteriales bacterium]|nr:SDR family oxidoreductase [Mycobacteriales bacterium]
MAAHASFDFTGTNVVVTGASRGIGAACVRAFAGAGARVALVARSTADMEAIAAQIGGDPIVITANLTAEDDVRRVADEVVDRMGAVDVLVNNAGMGWNQPADAITPKRLDLQLDLNLRNVILLTSWLAPSLIERRGSVVNMSSIAAWSGGTEQAVYAATKGALNSLTANLGRTWGPHGVRVNGIAPGFTDTDIWAALRTTLGEAGYEEFVATVTRSIPLRRWASSEEMAQVALFLCSDAASYVTSQTLIVDGGCGPMPEGT